MFSKQLHQTLFAYHWHTTRQLLDRAAQVSQDQYRARPDATRASLHEVFFHLLRVDNTWRSALESGQQPLPLSEEDHPDLEAIRRGFEQQERDWSALLERWSPEQIEGPVTLTRRNGETLTAPRWRLLQQVILHGMQHHAELAQLLTAYGQSPGDIDFLFFRG